MSSNPSLTRTRSLRKPTPGTATDLSHRPTAPTTPTTTSTAARRNVSPSRLPSLRPATRSVSSAAAAAAATTASASAPATAAKDAPLRRARPVSGTLVRPTTVTSRTQPNTTTTTTTRSQATAASATSRPQPVEPVKSRYPPNASSSAAAAATIKRPTSSGGLPSHTRTRSTTTAPARPQGHVRARSTVTASSTPSLSAAPVLRPPSAGQTTRPARPPSADRPPKPPTTANPTTNPLRLLQKKPAFSTLQQHYSPLRNTAPKPTTASYLAPPSPSKLPSNIALTAETARLQTTLLQLHLLHRDAPATAADWRASAHARLAERHTSLAAHHAAAADDAASASAALNTLALRAWPAPLEQALPTLDTALDALPALEAKHAALSHRFARWAARLPTDRDADLDLDLARNLNDPNAVLVGPLDETWKADAAALTRKLAALDRRLATLPAFPEAHAASSPARALEGSRALVAGMLAELSVMEGVERSAVASESAWIRRVNREDEDARRDGPRAGAVWRVI
ncbi:hypothetical protein ACHAQA_001303 [Verticillium albo-atrum]